MTTRVRSMCASVTRLVLTAAFVTSVSTSVTSSAWAESADEFPSRPVRILVHVGPGGGTDVAARVIAEKLSDALGQPFVVENRPGGGGRLILETVAKAAPDGYTLSVSPTGAMFIGPSLYRNPGFDPLRDFAPISNMVGIPLVLTTNATTPFRSLGDVVERARQKPESLDYASPGGAGTTTHVAMEILQSVTKMRLTMIPYKGIGEAHSDLISGRIPLMADALSAALPQIRAGKLRAIAVFSSERNKLAPEIPTVAESGYPGFDATSTVGLVAPAKTPPAILDKLNREIVRVVAQPAVQERLQTLGFLPQTSTPRTAYGTYMKAEIEKWGAAVKAAKIPME